MPARPSEGGRSSDDKCVRYVFQSLPGRTKPGKGRVWDPGDSHPDQDDLALGQPVPSCPRRLGPRTWVRHCRGRWSSGEECSFSFIGGATASVGGKRLNYACDDDLAVYGAPERSEAVWTVRVGRDGPSELTTSSIELAWF